MNKMSCSSDAEQKGKNATPLKPMSNGMLRFELNNSNGFSCHVTYTEWRSARINI